MPSDYGHEPGTLTIDRLIEVLRAAKARGCDMVAIQSGIGGVGVPSFTDFAWHDDANIVGVFRLIATVIPDTRNDYNGKRPCELLADALAAYYVGPLPAADAAVDLARQLGMLETFARSVADYQRSRDTDAERARRERAGFDSRFAELLTHNRARVAQ